MKKTLLILASLFCFVLHSSAQWTITYLSESKSYMGSTSLGNKAYFAGGYNGTDYLTTVEVYDVTTATCNVVGNLSVAREIIGGVTTCGSKIFFAGGFDWSVSYSTVDIFDTLTGQWTIQQLSIPRFSLVAVSYLNKVLFAGGFLYPSQTRTNAVDIYDCLTNEWTTTTLSLAREGIAAAVVGDLAIFAGGITNSGATDRVDIYHFTDNSWSQASLSQARGMASATTAGDKVIIAGGVTSFNNPTARVDIYDASTGEWSIGSLSFPRSAQTNDATVNDKAYFAGGGIFTGSGYKDPSDVIDIYEPEGESWSIDYLSQPLINHSVVEVGNYLVIAGGENDNGDFVSTLEVFHSINVGVEAPPVGGQQSPVIVYPNPTSGIVNLQFTNYNLQSEKVRIVIFDLWGQEVATVLDGPWPGGQVVRWDATNLPAGIYYYRLTTNDFRLTTPSGKIVKY